MKFRPGEKYRTSTGSVVEIIGTDLLEVRTGAHYAEVEAVAYRCENGRVHIRVVTEATWTRIEEATK